MTTWALFPAPHLSPFRHHALPRNFTATTSPASTPRAPPPSTTRPPCVIGCPCSGWWGCAGAECGERLPAASKICLNRPACPLPHARAAPLDCPRVQCPTAVRAWRGLQRTRWAALAARGVHKLTASHAGAAVAKSATSPVLAVPRQDVPHLVGQGQAVLQDVVQPEVRPCYRASGGALPPRARRTQLHRARPRTR